MSGRLLRILSSAALLLAVWPSATALAAAEEFDEIGAYFKVMWGLLIVLAFMLVLYALFRKRFSIINPRSTKAIRVLEIQPLMPRKAICLVEVRGREFLLGVGSESITLLADLHGSGKNSFRDILDETASKQSS